MLKTGILNPQLNSLLSRVRHTNLLVIADRGFPYWPMIETIDIALEDRSFRRIPARPLFLHCLQRAPFPFLNTPYATLDRR